jgi:hypothetical protein
MAFTQTIDTNWGITISNAYNRVEAVSLIAKDSISFHLRSYVEPNNKPFFKEQVFTCFYNIEGSNPIKQAYLYLKSLSEFDDTTDC